MNPTISRTAQYLAGLDADLTALLEDLGILDAVRLDTAHSQILGRWDGRRSVDAQKDYAQAAASIIAHSDMDRSDAVAASSLAAHIAFTARDTTLPGA